MLILSKISNAVHNFLFSLVCLLLTFCTIRFLLTVLVTTLHVPSFCTVTACTPAPLSTSRINHYYQTSCSDSVLAHSLIHSFLPSFFFYSYYLFTCPFVLPASPFFIYTPCLVVFRTAGSYHHHNNHHHHPHHHSIKQQLVTSPIIDPWCLSSPLFPMHYTSIHVIRTLLVLMTLAVSII